MLVWVFFYGSYINLNVLAEVDLRLPEVQVASLSGFELRIAPRANLVPSEGNVVWGILCQATHAELERLYRHAREVLGQVYLPQAVLVRTIGGAYQPALTYVSPEMPAAPAEPDYVRRILNPARDYHFPAAYLAHIESFL